MKPLGPLVIAIALSLGTTSLSFGQCNYEAIELPIPDCGLIDSQITPLDINNSGVVIGYWRQCDLDNHAIYHWSEEDGINHDFFLPPNAETAEAYAINDKGHFVGWASDAQGNAFGWAWIDGQYHIINIPDGMGVNIEPAAINNNDEVVGWFGTAPLGERYAFHWHDGQLTLLDDVIGSSNACATAINDNGVIVARYFEDDLSGLVLSGTEVNILPSLGCGIFTVTTAINRSGEIVGSSPCMTREGVIQAALYWPAADTLVDLGSLPGQPDSGAADINRFGVIVGTSTLDAWVWRDGSMYNLSKLTGVNVTAAQAINDRGLILDNAQDYVLKPLTSPADANTDCVVDAADLGLVLNDWGAEHSPADVDMDGIVGPADLAAVLSHWTVQ